MTLIPRCLLLASIVAHSYASQYLSYEPGTEASYIEPCQAQENPHPWSGIATQWLENFRSMQTQPYNPLATPSKRYRALNKAIEAGRLDRLKTLMKKWHIGPNNSIPRWQDREGGTFLLSMAIRAEQATLVDYLVECHASVNKKDSNGHNAFSLVRNALVTANSFFAPKFDLSILESLVRYGPCEVKDGYLLAYMLMIYHCPQCQPEGPRTCGNCAQYHYYPSGYHSRVLVKASKLLDSYVVRRRYSVFFYGYPYSPQVALNYGDLWITQQSHDCYRRIIYAMLLQGCFTAQRVPYTLAHYQKNADQEKQLVVGYCRDAFPASLLANFTHLIFKYFFATPNFAALRLSSQLSCHKDYPDLLHFTPNGYQHWLEEYAPLAHHVDQT